MSSGYRHRSSPVSSAADEVTGSGDAFARFFALSLDMLCVCDFEGYFTQVNPAFERILGYSRDELTRAPFMSFVHPDDHAATLEEFASIRDGGETLAFENRYRSRSRSRRTTSCRRRSPTS
jgi:PAS domain S-box-containing protein